MSKDELDDLREAISTMRSRHEVHEAQEEATFESIHSKLDDLKAQMDRHLGEHAALMRSFQKGMLGVFFTTLGAVALAGWEWLRRHFG